MVVMRVIVTRLFSLITRYHLTSEENLFSMLDTTGSHLKNSSPSSGSAFTTRLRKAFFQPYKIPGFLKRQYQLNFQSVVGSQIVWPEPGRAVLIKSTLPRPQQHQVLILTHASLVSPGTERAFLNRLPNTQMTYPYFPGYSGAGTVVEIGSDVKRFRIGDRVAGDFPHASIALVEEEHLIPVPEAITFEEACFVWLGVIALQGVRKAHLQFGERVAVLGQGLIGQIVTQLAVLSGAYPITAIAASSNHLSITLQSGAHHTLSLAENLDCLDRVEADVTIEVSGNPEAIITAIDCTKQGGRVILLGSTRGTTQALDLEKLRAKQLTIIGAHLASLPNSHSLSGWWTSEKEADTFLQLIAQRRINVDSLRSDEIYPSEAERFYRRLAWGDKSIVAGIFRWNQLSDNERLDGLLRQALEQGRGDVFVREKFAKLIGRSVSTKDMSATTAKQAKDTTMVTESKPLRIGLVGCGEIAVTNAQAIKAAPNATITVVTDVNEAVARDLAKFHNVPHVKTIEELLARNDVDAVLISVPHFLHAPLAIQAVRAGKHVIVEKPMATTLAEAGDMISAAQKASMHLAVLYCQRYLPYVQQVKALIDQGALGKILGVALQLYIDKPTSYYTSGFTGRVATDWRLSKKKSGGGILIFNAVHYLDMIRYMTGLEVTRVYGDFGALDTPLETEDSISVTMRYNNQAIGSLSASSVVRGSLIYAFTQLRIWGTDGQIVLTEPNQFVFYSLRQINGYKAGEWHSLGSLSMQGEREEFITRFARAILRGEAPEMTPESAQIIQAIVEAIYQSGELQRPISLESLIMT